MFDRYEFRAPWVCYFRSLYILCANKMYCFDTLHVVLRRNCRPLFHQDGDPVKYWSSRRQDQINACIASQPYTAAYSHKMQFAAWWGRRVMLTDHKYYRGWRLRPKVRPTRRRQSFLMLVFRHDHRSITIVGETK